MFYCVGNLIYIVKRSVFSRLDLCCSIRTTGSRRFRVVLESARQNASDAINEKPALFSNYIVRPTTPRTTRSDGRSTTTRPENSTAAIGGRRWPLTFSVRNEFSETVARAVHAPGEWLRSAAPPASLVADVGQNAKLSWNHYRKTIVAADETKRKSQ